MTQSSEAASALPLSLTYAPDGRMAVAVRALVTRVGALAGASDRARAFAATVQAVVDWVTTEQASIVGDVAMVFDSDGETLHGDLRWSTTRGAPAPPFHTWAAATGVDVACDVSDAEVRCRVTCRRA